MKKKTQFIILLLCLAGFANAQERVVERPPFKAWSSRTIEVDKVVLSDTATVLNIKAFFRPKNWIQIASESFLKDNTGKKYPLRLGIGIKPGERFWMPESGEADFKLVFPALPSTVTSIDFSEGEGVEGAFEIWGIQLKGELPVLELPKNLNVQKAGTTLPEPVYKYADAVLQGQFLDYTPGMPSQVILSSSSPANYEQTDTIQVNRDGTFRSNMKVATVTSVTLSSSFGHMNCLLAPGEETTMVINLRELTRRQSRLHADDKSYGEPVYYGGYLAAVQQELAVNAKIVKSDLNDLIKSIAGMSAEQYSAHVMGKYHKQIAEVEALPVSRPCKEILEATAAFNTIQSLCLVEYILKEAHIVANKLNRADASEYYNKTKIELPDNYYEVLKNFPVINSYQALYCSNYIIAVQNLSRPNIPVSQLLGTDRGVFFNNLPMLRFAYGFMEYNTLSPEDDAVLATLPASYSEMLRAENAKLLKKLELNKQKTGYIVNEVPQVANEELFNAILAKYRGKVVLVDFWATWCGPCRMANKEMIPMKEELKDKDIVYVYLTGETSPLKAWENMIPDIHGEHYRMTDAQWSYLREKMSVEGVPTYVVVNREGATTYRTTGFSGVDNMKTELLKAAQ